jgi:hypothetical protein
MEREGFVISRMLRIKSVIYKLGMQEILHSTFAPNALRNAEDGVEFGFAIGLPLLNQIIMQVHKFSSVFPRKNHYPLGEYPMLQGVKWMLGSLRHEQTPLEI